jgi:DNA-binding CsgD family transcriptional regulator
MSLPKISNWTLSGFYALLGAGSQFRYVLPMHQGNEPVAGQISYAIADTELRTLYRDILQNAILEYEPFPIGKRAVVIWDGQSETEETTELDPDAVILENPPLESEGLWLAYLAATHGYLLEEARNQPVRTIEISPREMEVLLLVARGEPNKSIAFDLGISTSTVKFHISHLMEKLHCSNRAELVYESARQGVISL